MTKKRSQRVEITTTISSRYLATAREPAENVDSEERDLVETDRTAT